MVKSQFVLPVATLEDLCRRHAEYKVAEKHNDDDTQNAFINLIWAQVHCSDKQQIKLGVKAAEEACEDDALQETGDEYAKLQLLYLSAVGRYKLGDIVDARSKVREVLQQDQHNRDAADLHRLIEKKYKTRSGGCLPFRMRVA